MDYTKECGLQVAQYAHRHAQGGTKAPILILVHWLPLVIFHAVDIPTVMHLTLSQYVAAKPFTISG